MDETALKELLANDQFLEDISGRVLSKADTFNNATNLLWYDLSPIVQMLYPFRQLIPLVSKLPRRPGNGGNALHWKRISGININAIEAGVSEGNRGGLIAIQLEDQTAAYKALGFESSVSFEARLGGKNMTPEALGAAVQSTLRSVMIAEEKALLLANATNALGTVGTVTLARVGSGSGLGGSGTMYVKCFALTGQGWLASSVANGIRGAVTRTNADSSTDTFGGGSSAGSAEASLSISTADSITASVVPITGAAGYAWFIATTTGLTTLAAITTCAHYSITSTTAAGTQLASSLSGDNSRNALLPDGLIAQIFGQIFGTAPSRATSSTNSTLPSTVTITNSGALLMTMANTTAAGALTFSGVNCTQFDIFLKAAWEQYKLGYSRILVNVQQMADISLGLLNNVGGDSLFRISYQPDQSGKGILAGVRITSYLNKYAGNTLDIEVHPYVPPGTVIFWSDSVPYDLPGVANIMEAVVRQDYYEIQWPLRRRAYEYGVYVDEVFACNFPPAFGAITNIYSTN